MSKRIAIAVSLVCALAGAAGARQKALKPWREWTKKDAEKVLNDSPWGQTQTETDTSEMFYKPTTQGQGRTGASNSNSRAAVITGGAEGGNNRAEEGALNQATSITYHIRWLTARPIRQAIARQAELQQGVMTDGLRKFVEGDSDRRAVVAVTFEATDQRFGGKVMQAFNSAVTSTLKNNTYLERKDGRRVFLQDYVPPQGNVLGAAMFVFPRRVGERPLLDEESGEVRFVSEFSPALKLNMKFKVSDMIYFGRLEY
jgi:hypothetical protein